MVDSEDRVSRLDGLTRPNPICTERHRSYAEDMGEHRGPSLEVVREVFEKGSGGGGTV
jgi:hypothetical protein